MSDELRTESARLRALHEAVMEFYDYNGVGTTGRVKKLHAALYDYWRAVRAAAPAAPSTEGGDA